MVYIGIANGSPCEVSFLEQIISPSTINSFGALQVFISMVDIERQRQLIFWKISIQYAHFNGVIKCHSIAVIHTATTKAFRVHKCRIFSWQIANLFRAPELALGNLNCMSNALPYLSQCFATKAARPTMPYKLYSYFRYSPLRGRPKGVLSAPIGAAHAHIDGRRRCGRRRRQRNIEHFLLDNKKSKKRKFSSNGL